MNECMFNDTTDVNCMLGCTGCAGRITKEDLKNYLNNKKFFRDRLAEYKEDLRIAEDLKAVVLDGMPKSHNKTSYALEETLDKINELIQEENKELDKLILIDKKLKMMKNTTYRNILYKKYIKNESLEQISADLHYNYRHICRLHGLALNEFDNIDKADKG